jgi:hypothetical protein
VPVGADQDSGQEQEPGEMPFGFLPKMQYGREKHVVGELKMEMECLLGMIVRKYRKIFN